MRSLPVCASRCWVNSTLGKAHGIVSGDAEVAKPSHVALLIKTYERVWSEIQSGNIEKLEPISGDDRTKLKDMAEKTGLGGVAIYNRISNPPSGYGKLFM